MSNDDFVSLNRCAIYTRKSVNNHLDRDINSLVTQREICSAYVTSQRYRSWIELPQRYDDGGHSGSGLERPSLSRMMQDIEAGQIDTVVVDKIDRLTRSLLDFVRLIEIFDRRNIALVSISQAFDTSNSMGRMILNILLTFSQFERELIAERVRDSIRTRKRHGKVHGGMPPFGYTATGAGIVVDQPEADIVRFIFAEFLRTERYTSVMNAVREKKLCSSVKYTKSGQARGGKLINPSTVYSILRSPIYVGEIQGHETTYQGRHDPIISRETWERAKLLAQARTRKPPHSKQTNHFLAGLLIDDLGRHMLLEVDWHRDKPYFCYSSTNAAWSQAEFRRAYRSNADRLESLVLASVSEFLSDRGKLRSALKSLGLYGEALDKLTTQGKAAAALLDGAPPEWLEELFKALMVGVEIGEERLTLSFRCLELRRFLQWDGKTQFRGRPADWPCSDARYDLEVAACAISAERWPVVHIAARDETRPARRSKPLIRLVREARKAQMLVESHRSKTLAELAAMMGYRPGHFSKLIKLNYLAPDIVTSILDGTQPSSLTSDVLRKANLPMDWSIQRKLFGFPAASRPIAQRQLFGRGMWPAAKIAQPDDVLSSGTDG